MSESVSIAEFAEQPDWRLYLLMRSDLESMNPGKGHAQAAHAQRHADHLIKDKVVFGTTWAEHYGKWCDQTDQGFGTTIVLETDGDFMHAAVQLLHKANIPSGVVRPDIPASRWPRDSPDSASHLCLGFWRQN